ncbi:ABC transporter related [Gluconacetobacter diazotrophicus PA1 5]|uniref:ABC transporter ATP-binding protein n=1 Tax=Gluconacetobacter diazotrophicus TaxID=33996 RepID=UPI000173AF22|nr:ABC transporter related [Gluconacetobacter diazotrophicus PA1 5]TWB02778.1 ABC transporter family protein [Gluconacetobacter diazotrophicus]
MSVRGLCNPHAGPVDFDVPGGACLVLTGMSGAGKTVLLRMIADLDPHQGDVALDGRLCRAMPAHLWRRQVVYCPAEPGWWSDSVLDHLPDDARTRDLLARAGLRDGLLRDPLHRLSTGERQRLALVRGLRQDPRVLLLDEPCSALDEATTRKVETILHAEKARGVAIVLISHDPRQADRMADLRCHMEHGRFARVGS